jgi:hypothetical protein
LSPLADRRERAVAKGHRPRLRPSGGQRPVAALHGSKSLIVYSPVMRPSVRFTPFSIDPQAACFGITSRSITAWSMESRSKRF